MQNKLFIGGLAWAIDSARLNEVFTEFGEITEAKVIFDRATGRSRGFGFVTFANEEDAKKALSLDGQSVDGRPVRVDLAKERSDNRQGGPSGHDGGNRY